MKKAAKKYIIEDVPPLIVSDYEALYEVPKAVHKKTVLHKDFTYNDFKEIADKSPFTLAEWADLLYMSERTLHRYAKENSGFNGLQIERILHLKHLINEGTGMFGKEGFKNWLHIRPYSFNGASVKEGLSTHEGIQEAIDLIGRMQQGIPA